MQPQFDAERIVGDSCQLFACLVPERMGQPVLLAAVFEFVALDVKLDGPSSGLLAEVKGSAAEFPSSRMTHAAGVGDLPQDGAGGALATDMAWVEAAHNVLLFGPSGVGKSHLAATLGHALIEHGLRVRYTAACELVQQLQAAKQELHLADALTKLDKYHLLVIDDIGYVKRSESETSVLFELIAHRYEAGSLLITSNLPFSAWNRVFPDDMMAVAAIDRLIHHAQVFELSGESYRKRAHARQQKEVAANS